MRPADETGPGFLRRLERRLVDRLTRRHLARLAEPGAGSGSATRWWRLLGAVVALPVHAVSVALAAGGLALLLAGGTWPLKGCGVVLLLAAIGTRPSPAAMPEHVRALRRTDAPALFGLLDAMAATSGAPVPEVVLVVEEFNAFAVRVGWRRTPVLGIGAPLWVPASSQARVALLGHELGHFAHGDLTHGFWVGGAQETLLHWLDIAGGMQHVTYEGIDSVQRYLFAPVRGLVAGYLLLITWVNAPAHQRQEYLADLDAATAGRTTGAVELLDLLISEPTVSTAITRAAVSPHRPDVWQVLTDSVDAIGPESRRRLREHATTEDSRIDDTHPATPLRLQLVLGRPHREPAVELDPTTAAAVDRELEAALTEAAKHVTDRVRYQH